MSKRDVRVFVVVFVIHFFVSCIIFGMIGSVVLRVSNFLLLLHVIIPPVVITLLIRFVGEDLETEGKKISAAVAILLFWILWMYGAINFIDNKFLDWIDISSPFKVP